jgi:predicted acylesterase/phospholipase RssA
MVMLVQPWYFCKSTVVNSTIKRFIFMSRAYIRNFLNSFILIISCTILLLASGCANVPPRHPLPMELNNQAIVANLPNIRFWGDQWPKYSEKLFATYSDADFQREFAGVYNTPHNYLAISGGGANGAFGAGLFAGWSASGKRPEFTMVTGVSTGALTAPFAFLGAEYDPVLKELYTNITTRDIAKKRNFISAMFSDSIATTKPLQKLLIRYVTPELVQAIGREYKRGRRLFIGTMNLDAARSVVWDIGAIAVSDYPKKVELIRKLMLASASIPVAFPPVAINVTANGETYDELHVDGGTGSQVFVYPASTDWRQITEKLKVKGRPQVYVIRNSFLDPEYHNVSRTVFPIASRSIDSLIRTQGIGDLYQIYSLCERDGNDFKLAYIPSSFTEKPAEAFDKVYMGKLYQLGYDLGLKGYNWATRPPRF